MRQPTFFRVITSCIALAGLGLTTACAEVEKAYDSAYQGVQGAYDSVTGERKSFNQSPTKVEVRSPAAAPYQDVKAKEIVTTPETSAAVELGSVRDQSLDAAPATSSVAAEVEPMKEASPVSAPQEQEIVSEAQKSQPQSAVASVLGPDTIPLLTIRFNQTHVYYDVALSRAVSAAEKTGANPTYYVLSTLPDLSSLPQDKQSSLAKRAEDNLKSVVKQMQQMGVDAKRINVANQVLAVRSQEIQLFVK